MMFDLVHFALPSTWADLIAKWALPGIALIGAVYTACQYQRAKRWRAGDLAAALIAQLETDEELAFACRAIDWGTGPLVVPKQYRPLLEAEQMGGKTPTASERGEIMQQDTVLLSRAVSVFLEFDPQAEPAGLVYRYCFDKLFAHLANMNRLLETRQLKTKDLSTLEYWLERIAKYEYPPPGKRGDEIFQPFLHHPPYGYRGVIALGRSLRVPGWN
jgi:hypothetical protein